MYSEYLMAKCCGLVSEQKVEFAGVYCSLFIDSAREDKKQSEMMEWFNVRHLLFYFYFIMISNAPADWIRHIYVNIVLFFSIPPKLLKTAIFFCTLLHPYLCLSFNFRFYSNKFLLLTMKIYICCTQVTFSTIIFCR